MIFAGIDPGLSGAVAAIFPDGAIEIIDTPIAEVAVRGRGGKGTRVSRRYADALMARAIRNLKNRGGEIACAVEAVHAMPEQGVSSSFHFGTGFGLWRGILAGLEIPYTLVDPVTWKRALMAGLDTKQKATSRLRAMQLFPAAADRLTRAKDDGRAEALLLAEWCRKFYRPFEEAANA